MRFLILVIIFFAQSLQAQVQCRPIFCGPEDIYFDALMDQNYCQMNERVSCQLNRFGSRMDGLLSHGNSLTYVESRLSKSKESFIDNMNLRGLLETAEFDFTEQCKNNLTREEYRNCKSAVQYAVTVYDKASLISRSLELPYYSSLYTNQEVAKLYQKSQGNKQRSDFFKTLQLDMKIDGDIGLWKLLEIVKEASRNERAQFFICNDSPAKMEVLVAEQKMLFLTGKVKENPALIRKAIDNLSKIKNLGLAFQSTCENPEAVASLLEKIMKLTNEWNPRPSRQKATNLN